MCTRELPRRSLKRQLIASRDKLTFSFPPTPEKSLKNQAPRVLIWKVTIRLRGQRTVNENQTRTLGTVFLSRIWFFYLKFLVSSGRDFFYLEFGKTKGSIIMGQMALVELSWGSKSNNIVCKRSSYINSHIMNCCRQGRMRRGKEQFLSKGYLFIDIEHRCWSLWNVNVKPSMGFPSQSQWDSPRQSLFARMQNLGCINVNVE